jgi:hypothetical protein
MNTLQGSFAPSKKPQKKVVVDNPFEALKDVGTTVAESVKEASTDAVKDMWAQILGADRYSSSASANKGDLKPGQELDLKDATKKKEQKSPNEAPMSYFKEIKEAGKTSMHKESAEIRQQVQSIMYELQRLAGASKAIEKHVAQSIGTGVVNPGKYHVACFEWMFAVIRDARKRVENAGAWLHTVKKKSGGFNKKNMSHLMSGERSVSNQTA